METVERKLIEHFLRAENKGLIDQSEGDFSEDKPCCFGAHLAWCIANETDFTKGRSLFFIEIRKKFPEFNKAHLSMITKEIGVDVPLFGSREWNMLPSEFLTKLAKIEDLPRLHHADLKGFILDGADLTKSQFSHSDMTRVLLDGSNLRKSEMSHVDLFEAHLNCTTLEDCNLNHADLRLSSLRNSNFDGANLSHANLRYASIVRASFKKANLSHASFEMADIVNVDFGYATSITGADFTNARFENVVFSKEQQPNIKLSDKQLRETKFL